MRVSCYNVMMYVKEATNVNADQQGLKGEVHSYFQHGTEQVAWCECTLKDTFQARPDIFKQKVFSEVLSKHRCYKGPF